VDQSFVFPLFSKLFFLESSAQTYLTIQSGLSSQTDRSVTIQVVRFNLIFGAPCSDQLELAENVQSTASRVVDKVASFGRRHTTEKLRPGPGRNRASPRLQAAVAASRNWVRTA
jgi:hypothetical protein